EIVYRSKRAKRTAQAAGLNRRIWVPGHAGYFSYLLNLILKILCENRKNVKTSVTTKDTGATTKTQDLRRRGREETEDSHPVTPKPGPGYLQRLKPKCQHKVPPCTARRRFRYARRSGHVSGMTKVQCVASSRIVRLPRIHWQITDSLGTCIRWIRP